MTLGVDGIETVLKGYKYTIHVTWSDKNVYSFKNEYVKVSCIKRLIDVSRHGL